MTKKEVIIKVFKENMFPAYHHSITGEIIPYDDRWNTIAEISDKENREVVNSFSENPRRLTKKEDEKLLKTAIYKIGTYEHLKTKIKIT